MYGWTLTINITSWSIVQLVLVLVIYSIINTMRENRNRVLNHDLMRKRLKENSDYFRDQLKNIRIEDDNAD